MATLIGRLNNDERAYRLAIRINRVRSNILNATDSPLAPGFRVQRTNEQIDALVTEYNGVLEEFINALNTDGLNFSSTNKENAAGTLLRSLTSLVNSPPPAGGGGAYNVAPPLDSLPEQELIRIIRNRGPFITFITQNKVNFIENQQSRGTGGRLLDLYEEFFDEIIDEWRKNGSDSRAIYIIHTFLKIDSLTRFNVINGESFWFQRDTDAIFNIRGLAGFVADVLPFPGISGSDEETPEVIEGEDAFDFLLQKEQGILAALNEKIVTEIFSKLDTAQDNIIQISSKDTELLVNRIQRRTDLKEFFNISSPYLSLIVPKIRLYKKLYVKEGDEYVLIDDPDFPNSRKEFKFKAFTDKGTIDQITVSGFGRGDGVGIKDVSWEYEGTNPETVNSFINFNISLFFQNLSDLIPSTVRDSVFNTLEDTSLIQLIGAGIGGDDTQIANNEENTPFRFMIEAELGWALSDQINDDVELFEGQRVQEIRKIIEDTDITLKLSLREHNINFNENGTLTLDLAYFSGIDQALSDSSMNILAIGRNTPIDRIISAAEQDAAERAAEARANREDRISRRDGDTCVGINARINQSTVRNNPAQDSTDEEEPISNRDIALLEALRGDGADSILNNYSQIFKGLLDSSLYGGQEESKVYQLTINARELARLADATITEALGEAVGGVTREAFQYGRLAAAAVQDRLFPGEDGNVEQALNDNAVDDLEADLNAFRIYKEFISLEALRTLGASNFEVRRINPMIGNTSELISDEIRQSLQDQARDADTLQEISQDVQEENLRQALEYRIFRDLSDGNDLYTISFIRLGDIIDNIITALKNEEGSFLNEQKDFFTFISGLYYYIDAIDGTRKAYNYCDMLISLNSFRSFFIEKIVRQLKTKYTLKQFVIDLIKDFSYVQSLVLVSEETYVRQDSRPAFSVFQGPDYDLENRALFQSYAEETGVDTDSSNWLEIANDLLRAFYRKTVIEDLSFLNDITYDGGEEIINYFTLKSTNFIVQSAEGIPDEVEDINRGIYHIAIGANRGILKSVNFRRDEIQGRREGRIVRAGGLNFSALREKYDVTITTFGAPFFFPGMYFYLNPASVGLGFPDQPNSAARILGIGGYYFINKVSNRISEGGNFETTIEASWNSYGDGLDDDGCRIPDPIIIVPPNASGITTLPIEGARDSLAGNRVSPTATPAPEEAPASQNVRAVAGSAEPVVSVIQDNTTTPSVVVPRAGRGRNF